MELELKFAKTSIKAILSVLSSSPNQVFLQVMKLYNSPFSKKNFNAEIFNSVRFSGKVSVIFADWPFQNETSDG